MTPDPATRARQLVEQWWTDIQVSSIWQRNLELLKDRIAAALTEPRGCPTPGACSCVALLAEARRALEDAVSGIKDIIRESMHDATPADVRTRLRAWADEMRAGRPAPDGEPR